MRIVYLTISVSLTLPTVEGSICKPPVGNGGLRGDLANLP